MESLKAQSIIVIGAGASGLMAARQLSKDNKVTILEATNRTGGRIHSFRPEGFSSFVEEGAEFIHGNLPVTLELLEEGNIDFVETGGNMYRIVRGEWKEQEEIVEGWDALIAQMMALQEDMTLQDFLQQYYPDANSAALRERVTRFAEGFDVADITRVSVFFLREEWTQEWDNQYHIPAGYKTMIDHLVKQCIQNDAIIHLNSPVQQVNWQAGKATVYAGDKVYEADKVVITIPVALLQKTNEQGAIQFIPAIDAYLQAAHTVGYGGVIKVVLEFTNPFWNAYKEDIGFIISDAPIPTWWTQLPGEKPLLTGWLGGPKVEVLHNTSDEAIMEMAIQSLAEIFGITAQAIKDQQVAGKVFNWCGHPFTRGAYSYITPAMKAALPLLNTPIEGTLFFAGEALYTGPHPGTVEAALVSGKEVAEKVTQAKQLPAQPAG